MNQRAEARKRRSMLSESQRQVNARRILEHILQWERYQAAKTLMVYVSVGDEVETLPLLHAALQAGKRVALPRCKRGGSMEAAVVTEMSQLRRGMLQIPEPPETFPALPQEEIELILAPGLLFDGQGNRLGQGGGYYDRYLAGYTGYTCGVAFAVQMVDVLATKPHDMRMDAIVTEHGIHIAQKE